MSFTYKFNLDINIVEIFLQYYLPNLSLAFSDEYKKLLENMLFFPYTKSFVLLNYPCVKKEDLLNMRYGLLEEKKISENSEKGFILGINTNRYYMISFMLNFLKKSHDNYIIIGDYFNRKNDYIACLNSKKELYFYKDEVYWVLDYDTTFEEIEDIYWNVSDASSLFMCYCIECYNFNFSKELSIEDFKVISNNIKSIVFEAYDGDGFVILE